jgi:type VI secretion system secreted protein Hcp
MAVDAYIYFEDPGAGNPQPKGETLDKTFSQNKAFEIKDFSFDVENATTIGSGSGGAAAGRTKFGAFTIKKSTDSASPVFFQNCVTGAHYGKVTLAIRKQGTSSKSAGSPFLTYVFGVVFTTKISWSGPGDEAPEESIEFVYGTLQVEYVPQSPDGTLGTAIPAGWSQMANAVYP